MRQRHPTADRKAFTLLELLIVITIITVLMSLTLVVMGNVTEQAEVASTKATLRKVQEGLNQRVESFNRAFKGSQKERYIQATRGLLANNDIYGVRDEVVEILAKKAAFRWEFPQRFVERILSPSDDDLYGVSNGLPDSIEQAVLVPVARQQLIDEGNLNPTEADVAARIAILFANHSASPESLATESAELLYYTLTNSTTFGAAAVDSDGFNNVEVADTDGDGLPEFVDAWGQPLRFYRWPTRLIENGVTGPAVPVPFSPVLSNPTDNTDIWFQSGDPANLRQVTLPEREVAGYLLKGLPPHPAVLAGNALGRDVLLVDPDDPVGRLYSELERLDGNNGRPDFSIEYNEVNYHTPETYHSPLVVSAGPDEELGLFEPNDTGNLGNLARIVDVSNLDPLFDNITNRTVRVGAAK